MALTYEWKLTGLKKRDTADLNDLVIGTRWELKGTNENDIHGTFSGATPFTSVDADPFVPFADLTEADVLGWIQGVVVDDYEVHVNGVIQKQIDALVSPVAEPDLPWAGS